MEKKATGTCKYVALLRGHGGSSYRVSCWCAGQRRWATAISPVHRYRKPGLAEAPAECQRSARASRRLVGQNGASYSSVSARMCSGVTWKPPLIGMEWIVRSLDVLPYGMHQARLWKPRTPKSNSSYLFPFEIGVSTYLCKATCSPLLLAAATHSLTKTPKPKGFEDGSALSILNYYPTDFLATSLTGSGQSHFRYSQKINQQGSDIVNTDNHLAYILTFAKPWCSCASIPRYTSTNPGTWLAKKSRMYK